MMKKIQKAIARSFICILTSSLIIIIFACTILSQYIALVYTQDQIKIFSQRLFETEIMYSRQLSQVISSQFNLEIQKFSQISKILNGKIKFKEPHMLTYMYPELIYTRQEDPQLLALFKKDSFLTSNWVHSNISKIDQLPQQGQDLLKNISRQEPLIRSLAIHNLQQSKLNKKYIGFENLFHGFGIDNIGTSLPLNLTYRGVPTPPGCSPGKYVSDFKCRGWYKNSQNAESISINPPTFYFGSVVPYISVILCQKLMKYNKTLDSDIMYSTFCTAVKVESLNGFFQNYAKSTVQSYLIEPISQYVIYDSTKTFDKYNKQTLSELELKYLQSQNEAQIFNQTLNQTFKSSLYKKLSSISLNQTDYLDKSIIEFEYNRNETQNYVIVNPIYLIDKLPQYQGLKNPQRKGYNIHFMFAQINILSNEFLQKNSQELNRFFIKYYLIYIIIIICIAIFSLFCAIIYSFKITNLFKRAIDHLIIILTQIQAQQKNIEIHQILTYNSEHTEAIFLSQETKELYQSFKEVSQFLLYTCENFFYDNQTETLLKLNTNIEFFKQFKNQQAVGITYNSIGSILLQQGHYLQAIEHFQNALTYAKYEIQTFITKNPSSSSSQLMLEYSFEEKHQKNQQKQNMINKSMNQICNKNVNQKSKQYAKNQTGTYIFVSDNDLKRVKSNGQEKIHDQSSNFDNTSQRYEDPKRTTKQSSNSDNQLNNKSQQFITPFNIKGTHIWEHKIRDQLYFQQILQGQIDDHPEERIQLMSSLFHRQQNLITALIAFQENQDGQQQKFKNKTQKQDLYYNFWKEIKNLLKKQIVICQFLPFGNNEIVELLILISKCQFNLDNMQKAENTLKFSEQLLITFQQRNELTEQNENMIQDENIQSSIANIQFGRQSEQTPKVDLQDDYFSQRLSNYQKQREKSIKYAVPELKQIKSSEQSTNQIKISSLENSKTIINQNLLIRQKYNSQQYENFEQNNNQFQLNVYSKAQSLQNNEEIQQGYYSTQQQDTSQLNTYKKEDNNNLCEVNDQSILEKSSNSHFYSFSMKDKRNISDKLYASLFRKKKQSNQTLNRNNTALTIEKEKQQNSFQTRSFKSKSIYNCQRFQDYQRENLCQNDNKQFDYSSVNFNIKELLTNFVKSEYLIKKQNYIDAALTLTSLFENNRILMSHFPYKIVDKLKQLFDLCNIKSKEFDDFHQKFNPNITMNVAIVYSCKNNDENCNYLQQIQLFKDLVSLILTSQNDKIGIMIFNQQEDIQQLYMELINIQQIQEFQDQISQDIQSAITGQSSDFLINFQLKHNTSYSFDNKSQLIIHKSDEQSKSPEYHENSLFCTFNRSLESNQCMQQKQIQDPGQKYSSNNLLNQITNPTVFNEKTFNNQYEQSDDLLENAHNMSGYIYQFIKTKNQPHKQIEDFAQKVKLNQTMGDCINQISDRESMIHSNSYIQQQNDSFYESIKETLNNFFIKHILFKNSLLRNYFKDNQNAFKLKDLNLKFNFEYLLKMTNNLKEQSQRYIIYISNKITLENDNTFEQMCQVLYYLNIQLIILSDQKCNNFLEQHTENGYEYHERIIIKVFYESCKIINYLKFQRDSLTNNIHPTFIQHY